MISKTSGLIWDMDGVLVDTGEYHFQAWKDTLSRFNIPFDNEIFRKSFGMNNEGLIRSLMGKKYTQELYLEISSRKETKFRSSISGNVSLLPGVQELLSTAQLAEFQQAIGSSAPLANIKLIIHESMLDDYFQAVVSAYDMPGKPDPSVFLEAASRLNLSPAECIVIEDSLVGIEAAKRAGMRCVAVTTTNPAKALSGADLIVERCDQISLMELENL